jgi:hypothetical protein
MFLIIAFSVHLVALDTYQEPKGKAKGNSNANGAVSFARYTLFSSDGFSFFLSPEVIRAKDLAEEFKSMAPKFTGELVEKLPKKLVTRFRGVKVFVELSVSNNDSNPAHYLGFIGNRTARELRTAKLVDGNRVIIPEKVNSVEITHLRRVLKDFKHPILLLHEFAHYYHDQVLGQEDQFVKSAYNQAKERKIYPSDSHAMSNHREYFAELTGVFFYPTYQNFFNTLQSFKEKDPQGYAMILSAYKIKDPDFK